MDVGVEDGPEEGQVEGSLGDAAAEEDAGLEPRHKRQKAEPTGVHHTLRQVGPHCESTTARCANILSAFSSSNTQVYFWDSQKLPESLRQYLPWLLPNSGSM